MLRKKSGGGSAILFQVVKEGLDNKVVFEKKLQESEEVCHVDFETSIYKGSEAGTCLTYLRNSKEAILAGEE